MLKKFQVFSIFLALILLVGCDKDTEPIVPDKPDTEKPEPENPHPENPDPEEPQPEPEVPHDGYAVYVYNNTGWDKVYLYMWGDKNNLNGSWPGMTPTGTTKINGYDFLYFDMGKENTGLTESLIFNNNDKQLNDYKYTITEDIYLEITSIYVTKIDPNNFTPSAPITNDGTAVTDMVVYEANPRFFGTNNCLNALSSHLPRIADLGCNVLWIMPICEQSTSSQSVGSPYSIKNYDVINPRYGTVADLQNLVKTAHDLGIRVMLDWVPNHTGWDNPWITEHPDWFLHENGKIVSPPGQGWNDVAQLDYSNPAVGVGMSEAIKYWVNTADIDGIRFDYADSPYITPQFWNSVATELRNIKNDFILLAECSNYAFYSYGFDMIYDWSSAPTISKAFLNSNASSIVTEADDAVKKVPQGDSILRYIFNHDVMAENSIDTYFGSINALPAAYVCAAMLNGTPLIYSGMDATGLSGKQSFFNYKTLTFSDALTPVYAAINEAFKSTMDVRKGALANYSSSKVVCFTRTTEDETLLVIVNTASSSQSFTIPALLQNQSMTDLITNDMISLSEKVELDPYQYLILTK